MEHTEQNNINVKTQPKWKKIVNIIVNVIFDIFIVLLLCFAISNIASKSKKSLSNIFGIGFLNVISDSMDGNKEDSFKVGDLLFVNIASKKEINNLKPEKDIIVVWDGGSKMLITHRLVDIIENPDGTKSFITQGDKVEVTNPSADYVKGSGNFYLTEKYEAKDILAIYTGKAKNVGNALAFLKSSKGFGLCIVLPTAILLFYEGFILVKNLLELNKKKLEKELENRSKNDSFDIEEEKRRIREELLAEMKKEQEQKVE